MLLPKSRARQKTRPRCFQTRWQSSLRGETRAIRCRKPGAIRFSTRRLVYLSYHGCKWIPILNFRRTRNRISKPGFSAHSDSCIVLLSVEQCVIRFGLCRLTVWVRLPPLETRTSSIRQRQQTDAHGGGGTPFVQIAVDSSLKRTNHQVDTRSGTWRFTSTVLPHR
jgi:hypothetical protein